MSTEFSMRMHVSSLKVPKCRCHAMHAQCVIYFNSKKSWARPKGISSGLRDRSDLDWQEIFGRVWDSLQNFDLIITSISNTLRRSLRKKMFNQGITSMRGFRNYQTTFGITMQTSCTKKLLVQPTATANQTWLYTRVPYQYYTRTTQNFISNIPTS
jgi:hypothetical protein